MKDMKIVKNLQYKGKMSRIGHTLYARHYSEGCIHFNSIPSAGLWDRHLSPFCRWWNWGTATLTYPKLHSTSVYFDSRVYDLSSQHCACTKGINDTAIHGKTKVQLLPTDGVSKKFMEEVVLFPSIFWVTLSRSLERLPASKQLRDLYSKIALLDNIVS